MLELGDFMNEFQCLACAKMLRSTSEESSSEEIEEIQETQTKIHSERKPLSVTQEKQVSSDCSKSFSYTQAENPHLPHVNTSTNVKSQLQNVIKEKRRQAKGRVGRPPKTENRFQNHYSARHRIKMTPDDDSSVGLKQVTSASVNVPVSSKKRRTIAGDPNDDLERRTNHNTMERSRRNSMKLLFQSLHEHVPTISANPKASKALILKESRKYIHELKKEEMMMMNEKSSLEMKNANLKKKIYALNKQRLS